MGLINPITNERFIAYGLQKSLFCRHDTRVRTRYFLEKGGEEASKKIGWGEFINIS